MLLGLTLITSSIAATWTVSLDGTGDFENIQDAIDIAGTGDTVQVSAGTYEGAIDFSGKDIEVVGTEGPETTIIDGDGETFWAVTFEGGEGSSAVLDGFTIENTTGWGAVHIDGSDPTVGPHSTSSPPPAV